MTTRRKLFTRLALALASLPLIAARRKPMASGNEILESFDGRDWARHFVAHVAANPAISSDEETMATWFANALMRGYDEAQRRHDAEVAESGIERAQHIYREYVRGAVARGWCSPENSHKAMDLDLARAITEEVMKVKPGLAATWG